jgi:WD40 repeat protein
LIIDPYKNGMAWGRAVFSPDAQYVVAGSVDGSLVIWNANTGLVDSVLGSRM